MDKSKMATPGTKIDYDDRKGGRRHEQMSREVEQPCGSYCCCDKCCEGSKKSLDDTLNPPEPDKYGPVCC
jgi:hypothetical protein